jgi:hypothetical protein
MPGVVLGQLPVANVQEFQRFGVQKFCAKKFAYELHDAETLEPLNL